MDNSGEVIQLVNKLQSYFRTTGVEAQLNLPQIVVVGAQSSGKSSVLDGLIGFSILPRGTGTVTKCPIIIQLITISEEDAEVVEEGVEFGDDKELGRIKDHDVVRMKILEFMDRNNGAITEEPVIIRVYSRDVVTLTVVDLPGIKRMSSTGEPSDMENRIGNLSRKYISKENTIILAVSPANYEICNSEGIRLAREVDREGNRTIGVLTKIDSMERGTNARDLLTGMSKDVKVKLGMIGLVNRSQEDVDNDVSVEQQLVREQTFLKENYCDLAHSNGVLYLRQRLKKLLVDHIRKCLPDILVKFETLLEETEGYLESIPNVSSAKDKYAFVNKVITRFEREMMTEMEGSSRSPEYNFLYCGIKIKDVFEKQFAEDMEQAGLLSHDGAADKKIQTALRNSGSYDSMFGYSEAVFRKLAQKQLKLIEAPAVKCADRVYELILESASRNLNHKGSFAYFPELRTSMWKIVNSMLNNRREELRARIKDYIQVQSTVFSLDAGFLKKIADIRRKLEKTLHSEKDDTSVKTCNSVGVQQLGFSKSVATPRLRMKDSGEREHRFQERFKSSAVTHLIKEMVKQYFNLVKAHTQDYIPKLIADRLITQFSSKGGLSDELRMAVLENYDRLTTLPDIIDDKRQFNVGLRDRLKDAIADVRDMLNLHVGFIEGSIEDADLTKFDEVELPSEDEETADMDELYEYE